MDLKLKVRPYHLEEDGKKLSEIIGGILDSDRIWEDNTENDFDWYKERWYLGTHNDWWLFISRDGEKEGYDALLRSRYGDEEYMKAISTILEKRHRILTV